MSCKLAVVGANSAVGEVLLQVLEERKFAPAEIYALSPDPTEEERVSLGGKKIPVAALADFDFSRVDLVFFVDEQTLAAEHGPRAADTGAFVIDCSAHFRSADDVPLVVPEINGHQLKTVQRGALIASPSAASIFLGLVLSPLAARHTLRRVSITSLQPASSRGKAGVDELAGQTARLLNGMPADPAVFARQMAFNLLPQTSSPSADGLTREELDLLHDTRRLLDDPLLSINPTCIQAPVFYAHSDIVSIEADEALSAAQVTTLLSRAPGLKVSRRTDGGPTAVQEGSGSDLVTVGRIRQSPGNDREVSLWCVGDNLRKGAALNAVQIAEILIKAHL